MNPDVERLVDTAVSVVALAELFSAEALQRAAARLRGVSAEEQGNPNTRRVIEAIIVFYEESARG